MRTDGVGLIPACAGNTGRSWLLLQAEGAHPRLRGEHMPGVSGTGYDGGSSPLARGTHLMYIGEGEAVGLIPACAGNTGIWNQPHARAGAHPRLRGEHNDADCRASIGGGSSPLARGTLSHRRGAAGSTGLIPACAGNTLREQQKLEPSIYSTYDFTCLEAEHPRNTSACVTDPYYAYTPHSCIGFPITTCRTN